MMMLVEIWDVGFGFPVLTTLLLVGLEREWD